MNESNECVLQALLCIGKVNESEYPANAEAHYLKALIWSDRTFGEDSPESGKVALALMDLYDKQKRQADSDEMQARIRSILIANAYIIRQQYCDLN